jgi:ribulose-5-phosphate 4-epimerase/fuculose-1-phosphate aldolase
LLQELAFLSQAAGGRADYVQGGGGNTSVKLDGGLMAIKASGYRLRQVTETDGFAVVETETLRDVTGERGYKPLRPSVEAGFHALLGRCVLHTHPVYANLALCSENGADRLPALMSGYHYITVPYVNPGTELCAAIRERLRPGTQVVFLRNHGLIVTADTAGECLQIHNDINERIGKSYGVTRDDFAAFSEELRKILYPDHQIYLSLTDTQREVQAAVMFIQFTLMKTGGTARAMDGAALDYITRWDGDGYRKAIVS